MVAIENVLLASVTVFAFALTTIAMLAWRRTRDPHLLVLGGAFGLFFAKGLALSVALFLNALSLANLFIVSGSFDLLILALFYGFTLRR